MNPIFIVGAPRSGTTLLQYMLRSHPDVSLPTAESHFFVPFYNRRHEFGDLSDKNNLRQLLTAIYQARKQFFDEDMNGLVYDTEWLTDKLHQENRTTVPAVIDGLFSTNAQQEGKHRWGDKTPYYVLHLDLLINMFPGAQIVHIVRDGRDCALSMLERKWDLEICNIHHAAYIWSKYVKAGSHFGETHPDIYHEIYYEDILNQPETTIKSLCNFLNIDFSDQIIHFKPSDGSGKTPLLTKPLQKTNSGKWQASMSRRQQRIFLATAFDWMQAKGYLSGNNARFLPLEEKAYSVHIKICRLADKLRKLERLPVRRQ